MTARSLLARPRVERDVHLLQEYAAGFPETFGGLSIEDRRRRGLHVQLRFTEDLAARRGEIRRRWDHRFRVTRVRWSLAHLESVSVRLRDGRLRDAGIEPIGWGPDIRRNRVDLSAATERRDAAQVVREVYGEEVVRVGIVLQVPYDQTDDLAAHDVSVRLSAPLGDREARSIRRGRPVPDR